MKLLHRFPLVAALCSVPLLWLASPGGGDLWWLSCVMLVPFFSAVSNFSGRGFLAGLAVGLFMHLSMLYWIVYVLGHYGGLPVYLSVPAVVLLSLYMGVYVGLAAFATRICLANVSPAINLFAIPAIWVGLDWLRSFFGGGFPWMDVGYFLAPVPWLIQAADLYGHYGITYLVVFVNMLLVLLPKKDISGSQRLQLALPALVLVLFVGWYCQWRWQQVEHRITDPQREKMTIGLVQGNIDQAIKWSPEFQQQTLAKYISLSMSLFGERRPDLLVWPETALPFYPPGYKQIDELFRFSTQFDTALITGAPWYEVINREERKFKFYNSALLLEPGGQFTGKYFKSHLVPFGEYVPLQKYLPFIAPLVQQVGDFTPGKVEVPLLWKQGRAGVLICYESIFGELARAWVNVGANILVNVTNDAWYGKTSAPHHSMAMTIFRAVETRRSLVRAANTGISGFVDPLGRVQSASPVFTDWAKAEEVVLVSRKTFFVQIGYFFAPLCFVAGLVILGSALIRQRLTRESLSLPQKTV